MESAEEDVMSKASELELRERGVRPRRGVGLGMSGGFVRISYSLGQARAGGRGEPHRAERTVDGNGLCVSSRSRKVASG